MDEVAAIELGRYLHGEAQLAPCCLDLFALRHGADEVSTEADERLHAPGDDGLARLDRVQALVARRREAVLLGKLVERYQIGLFGDADGALALHVGMAAHRADAGAGLADIAA